MCRCSNLWFFGLLEFKVWNCLLENFGFLVFWFFGTLVYWFIGTLDFWFIGRFQSLGFWFFGTLVYWFFGFLELWFIGFLECWLQCIDNNPIIQ